MKRKRLGELLQERGQISAESLQQLFNEQKDKVIRLGELILERGLVEKAALTQALEEVSHIPYVDCSTVVCDPKVLQLIPAALAYRLSVLPIRIEDSKLVVAMTEPQNLTVLDQLRFGAGMSISPRFSFVAETLQGIARNYGQSRENSASDPDHAGFAAPRTGGPSWNLCRPVRGKPIAKPCSKSGRRYNRRKLPPSAWSRTSFKRPFTGMPATFTSNRSPRPR